jgi:hypothetical protein
MHYRVAATKALYSTLASTAAAGAATTKRALYLNFKLICRIWCYIPQKKSVIHKHSSNSIFEFLILHQ